MPSSRKKQVEIEVLQNETTQESLTKQRKKPPMKQPPKQPEPIKDIVQPEISEAATPLKKNPNEFPD